MGIITRIISHIYSTTTKLQDRLLRLTTMRILSLFTPIFMLLRSIMRALSLFIMRSIHNKPQQQDICLQNIRLFIRLPQMFIRLRDECPMFKLIG